MLFFLTLGLGAVALVLLDLDPVSAITGAAACLSNVGPGLGPVLGPAGTYAPPPRRRQVGLLVPDAGRPARDHDRLRPLHRRLLARLICFTGAASRTLGMAVVDRARRLAGGNRRPASGKGWPEALVPPQGDQLTLRYHLMPGSGEPLIFIHGLRQRARPAAIRALRLILPWLAAASAAGGDSRVRRFSDTPGFRLAADDHAPMRQRKLAADLGLEAPQLSAATAWAARSPSSLPGCWGAVCGTSFWPNRIGAGRRRRSAAEIAAFSEADLCGRQRACRSCVQWSRETRLADLGRIAVRDSGHRTERRSTARRHCRSARKRPLTVARPAAQWLDHVDGR